MTADPETARLAEEAAEAIRQANLPRLKFLITQVETRLQLDAMSKAAMTPCPPHE